MKRKLLVMSLMIFTMASMTACNEETVDTMGTVESVVESVEATTEPTIESVVESTEPTVESETESVEESTEEAPADEAETEITEETTEPEETEIEVVEEETTESDEQLVSSLNLPEDERQFYMDQFGLTSEQLDALTVDRLYELIDDYLNSLIDGGGSSSGGGGGGGSTGGGSDNDGRDDSGENGWVNPGRNELDPTDAPAGSM